VAKDENADMIGLSRPYTPSLDEMVQVAKKAALKIGFAFINWWCDTFKSAHCSQNRARTTTIQLFMFQCEPRVGYVGSEGHSKIVTYAAEIS